LLGFIEGLEKEHKEHKDCEIAVLIPEVVKRAWWEHLLHTRRAQRPRAALLRFSGPRLIVINLTWHLDKDAATSRRPRTHSPKKRRPHHASRRRRRRR
jgi:hypothetical protein